MRPLARYDWRMLAFYVAAIAAVVTVAVTLGVILRETLDTIFTVI